MPLLFLLAISVLQWATVMVIIEFAELTNINFDPVTLFYGNLQIIVIIFAYRLIKKYIRI